MQHARQAVSVAAAIVLVVAAVLGLARAQRGIPAASAASSAQATCPTSLSSGWSFDTRQRDEFDRPATGGGTAHWSTMSCSYRRGSDYLRATVNWTEDPGETACYPVETSAEYDSATRMWRIDGNHSTIQAAYHLEATRQGDLGDAREAIDAIVESGPDDFATPCADTSDSSQDPTPTTTTTESTTTSTTGTVATTTTETTSTTAPSEDCSPSGKVTFGGEPIEDITVQMRYLGQTVTTTTGTDGDFSFRSIESFDPLIVEDASAGAGAPDPESIVIGVVPREGSHNDTRFAIWYDNHPNPELLAPPIAPGNGGSCTATFDLRAPSANATSTDAPLSAWPALGAAYLNLDRAWRLLDQLGIEPDYGIPLEYRVACDSFTGPGRALCPPAGSAHFSGSLSNGTYRTDRPYIGVGVDKSRWDWPDAPANREYHEFGHYVLADLLGNAIPMGAGRVKSHAGYFVNNDSSDAFSEGFAEFFALMVNRDVNRRSDFWMYPIGWGAGNNFDLEQDWKPWDMEEFAVAGILLDLVDDDEQYAQGRTHLRIRVIGQHRASYLDPRTAKARRFHVGVVRNTSARDARDVIVTATFLLEDGTKVQRSGMVLPRTIRPDDEASFTIAYPEHAANRAPTSVEASGAGGSDDDPVNGVKLDEVVAAIESHRTNFPADSALGKATVNVDDLHAALVEWFATRDDGPSEQQIDDLFIAHGYYADIEGGASNHAHDAGEVVGMSSHYRPPAADAPAGAQPTLVTRHNASLPAAMVASVGTGGVDTVALVDVSYPGDSSFRSYGFLTVPDDDGNLQLAVPPRDSGATVTVTMVADGYLPAVAGTIDPQQFWDHVDKHGADDQFLAWTVKMRRGTITVGGKSVYGTGEQWAFWIAAVVFIASIVALLVQWRRRSDRRVRVRTAILGLLALGVAQVVWWAPYVGPDGKDAWALRNGHVVDYGLAADDAPPQPWVSLG